VPAGIKPLNSSSRNVPTRLIDVHTHRNSDPGGTGYPGLGISTPRAAISEPKTPRLD